MKKYILKKKKIVKVCRQRKVAVRILSAAAVVCLLAGMTLSVYGNEKEEESVPNGKAVTEIYHKHTGNKEEPGGCYFVAVTHEHQGDEISGGACFQTPVYHSHKGDQNESGGCYVLPVTHEHQGDEQQGGACYEEITHTHVAECYEQADCLMTHTPDGNILETLTDRCFSHGQVTFGRSKGIANHQNCGKGQEERTYRYCLTCGYVSPSAHSYEKLVCPIEEGTVTGYERSCGKDETTIDYYTTGCGLEEQEIEGYLQSCYKEAEEYTTGCGFTENQLCGRLILTNETPWQTESAIISARLEDLTGGSLKLSIPPYEWRDNRGQVIGNQEKVTVNENGSYFVTCCLGNSDVKDTKLHGSITVGNICKGRQSPVPEASTSPGISPSPEQTAEASPSYAPEEGKAASSGQDGSEGGETIMPASRDDIIMEITENAGEDEKSSQLLPKTKRAYVQEKISPFPSPEKVPVIKESQKVEMKEYEASKEAAVVKEEKQHTGFFDLPSVKIISVAGSVLALIFSILLLLFYLRRSVKVLNDDGEGRMICLGHCMVKTENDCYRIVITEKMEEKACTNRYCIRPGLFRLGKKEGEELVIVKGSKSVTSYIDKEMIVML